MRSWCGRDCHVGVPGTTNEAVPKAITRDPRKCGGLRVGVMPALPHTSDPGGAQCHGGVLDTTDCLSHAKYKLKILIPSLIYSFAAQPIDYQ